MHSDELKAKFDVQAETYDLKWAKMAPIRDNLFFLLESIFSELPKDARILCVGVGTGAEVEHLALKFPGWNFTLVEPSGAMLIECRKRAESAGFDSRCYFHEGYLESLAVGELFDASTCFLVSQFILESSLRSNFFRLISNRLKDGGVLASSDLAAENPESFGPLLKMWADITGSDSSPEGVERMRAGYAKDVAIRSPTEVVSMIRSGGFMEPVRFFQAGLINAWVSKRSL